MIGKELLVDLFAGGGGASLGIELATGAQVDAAVNHDRAALAMHRQNHRDTMHYEADVFEVDPHMICQGRPVGLLWASPDCTDHSKAKGGKPIRNKRRRALAWVITRWAGQVRPRCIIMENVEEFTEWGPLVGRPGNLRRCEKRKGKTFRRFVRSLVDMGYEVEHKELRACDFGAPTIRKRLFLIARCDGKPIVWPAKTHGPKSRPPKPWRTAAECIDWSIPMCSILATKEEAKAWAKQHGVATPRRPLAHATMRRIARGIRKYILDNPTPYVVPQEDAGLMVPYLVPRYGEREGQKPRVLDIDAPYPVVVPTANGGQLVAAFLARHWGGMTGKSLKEPMPTVMTKGAQDQLTTATLVKLRGTSVDADVAEPLHTVSAQGNHHAIVLAHMQRDFGASVGQDLERPLGTVTAGGGGKAALVYSFLQRYNGQGIGGALEDPAPSVTSKDRLGLVTVVIDGATYVIVDIAMRMLAPRELYRAQGFPDTYHIAWGMDELGDPVRFTKAEQVRMVGNSVSPPQAAALVWANLPEMAQGAYEEAFVA